MERARRYLAKLPCAISGSRGHDATFRAASVLACGFNLPPQEAVELLREWNTGCQPPWSDRELVRKVNEALRHPSAYGRGYLLATNATDDRAPLPLPTRPKPAFQAGTLARIAAKAPIVSEEWLAAISPKRVQDRTPASFLHELYRPGERVLVFTDYKGQGEHLWEHRLPPFDARELDGFRKGAPEGVWFLAQPVSGETLANDEGKPSRRSWQNVTSWRYCVLESDKADPLHWLATLAQMPLPLAAIYTSGGRSIHALVRIDAASREDWNATVASMKPALVTLGADPGALTPVRLTRLPCCERVEKGQVQRLLYLARFDSIDARPLVERSPL